MALRRQMNAVCRGAVKGAIAPRTFTPCRLTLLPPDDCLRVLQRCFQRHGISQVPEIEGNKWLKKKFKSYPISFFHIDIAEVQKLEGKLHPVVAIDHTSKLAYARLFKTAYVSRRQATYSAFPMTSKYERYTCTAIACRRTSTLLRQQDRRAI